MVMIKGVATNKDEAANLPKGSVAYVYVIKNSKSIGHHTEHNLHHFPFHFHVDVPEAELADGDISLRVSVENGEQVLFINENNGNTPLAKGQNLDNLSIELHKFVE